MLEFFFVDIIVNKANKCRKIMDVTNDIDMTTVMLDLQPNYELYSLPFYIHVISINQSIIIHHRDNFGSCSSHEINEWNNYYFYHWNLFFFLSRDVAIENILIYLNRLLFKWQGLQFPKISRFFELKSEKHLSIKQFFQSMNTSSLSTNIRNDIFNKIFILFIIISFSKS